MAALNKLYFIMGVILVTTQASVVPSPYIQTLPFTPAINPYILPLQPRSIAVTPVASVAPSYPHLIANGAVPAATSFAPGPAFTSAVTPAIPALAPGLPGFAQTFPAFGPGFAAALPAIAQIGPAIAPALPAIIPALQAVAPLLPRVSPVRHPLPAFAPPVVPAQIAYKHVVPYNVPPFTSQLYTYRKYISAPIAAPFVAAPAPIFGAPAVKPYLLPQALPAFTAWK